jgi:hypothetical protein
VRRLLAVMSGVVSIAALLAVAPGAEARVFRVYTCSIFDEQRPLGPTIQGGVGMPSGWELDWSSLTIGTVNDQCAVGSAFVFRVEGPPMVGGQSVWARWTAPAGTRLVGLAAAWSALSDLSPGRSEGTGQVVAETDQQTLLTQNSPLTVEFGVAGASSFAPSIVPAQAFQLRFTCLDRCATGTVTTLRATVWDARFDVEDSSSPVGGLVGPATDAQVWSRVTRFGLNAADSGGGLYRAMIEVDGVDALPVPLGDAARPCRELGRDPNLNEFAAAQPCPLRIDNGSLDVDTTKLPQGRHVVRVLLEDAAGNRTAVFGPVTRNITSSEAIGPGSDPALRGARER